MTGTSAKQKIIARLLAVCQPMIALYGLRKAERRHTLWLLEPVKPALHLIVGDEVVQGEDTRGYTLQFPVMFKLILTGQNDLDEQTDKMSAYLQETIEADLELCPTDGTGLCSALKYDGELPFTEELMKPDGGTVLMYLVQYRRERGNPGTKY